MNETSIGIKFTNKVTGQEKLEKYEQTLEKIKSALKNMPNANIPSSEQISATNTETKELTKNTNKVSESFNTAFSVGKITIFLNTLKNVVTKMTSLTKISSTYIENMNLLNVAYNKVGDTLNENTKSATKMVNRLSEMYGLDESWGYRTVGIFKQLSNAMGLTDETGTKLSNTLSMLSIDLSSLYNTDVDTAVEKIQSALAGQTKAIRAYGADITQNTLQQVLWANGINKSITELSYAEKRLVIVTALLQQTSEAQNDWARTIESPANQMRILEEQISRLSRAIGNVFLPIISKILPYLNAVAMVLTEIISWIAVLVGYNPSEFDYTSALDDSVVDTIDGIGTSLDDATASSEKLKTSLRGFDKLNNITTPTSSSSGTSGTSGSTGVSSDVLDMFNKASDSYMNTLMNVNMKATKIRDNIMEWLGFTKEVDEETGDVSFKFDHITGGTVLGALAVGGVIFKGVTTIYGLLKKIGVINFSGITKIASIFSSSGAGAGISTAFTGLASTLGISAGALAGIIAVVVASLVAMGVAFKQVYDRSEEFRGKIANIIDTLKELISGQFERLKTILSFLYKSVLQPLWENVLKPLWNLYVDVMEDKFNFIVDRLQDVLNLFTTLSPYLDDLIKTALPVIASVLGTIFSILGTIIEKVDTLYKTYISPLIDYLSEKLSLLGEWLTQYIIEKITKIIDKLKEIWHNWLEPIYIFLKAYILLAIYNIRDAFEKIKEVWHEIKAVFKEVWEEYVQPKLDKLKELIDKVKKAWQEFKDSFKLPELNIPKLPKFKLSVSYDTNVSAGKKVIYEALGLEGWPNLSMSSYANGGMPSVGQMFIANERGPELVGQIGGQSFVANQNQMLDIIDRKLSSANSKSNQVFNFYLDANHKIGSYTLSQLQDMSKDMGKPITIGG